jgi:hypothetical protein
MIDRLRELSRRVSRSLERRRMFHGLPSADRQMISRIRSLNLTYLSERKLACIARTCREIREAGLPGAFIEAGCALGGSTILIGSVKDPDRPFTVYDVFGMIPPPSENDTPDVHERYRTIASGESTGIGGDRYYGYVDDLFDVVQGNLRSHGLDPDADRIRLVRGLLQETLTVDGPVAFAHVDVDWHDPVLACLERIYPRLVPGGSIILDDYHDWGGCRKATDAFLHSISDPLIVDDSAGSLKLTRTAV